MAGRKGPLGFVTVSGRNWNHRPPKREEENTIMVEIMENYPDHESMESVREELDITVVEGRNPMMADRTAIVLSTSGSLDYIRMMVRDGELEVTQREQIKP